jgi:hypothetical protein
MTRDKALAELKRLIGAQFRYWDFPKAMNADERRAAREALAEIASRENQLLARMKARKAEVARAGGMLRGQGITALQRLDALGQDPEYQELNRARTSLRAERKAIICGRPFYRYEVARPDLMGNALVCAKGDTWEEILVQCRAEKRGRRSQPRP